MADHLDPTIFLPFVPFAEHREPQALPTWVTSAELAKLCSTRLSEKDFSSENQSFTDLERNSPSFMFPFLLRGLLGRLKQMAGLNEESFRAWP